MKVGDIQTDIDNSEWVVVSITGRDRVSRVRRNSLAHRVHAERSAIIAQSLDKEVDGPITTASENRPDTAE